MGVSRVEFYQNGVLVTAMNTVPFTYSWNTATASNGSYTLTVKAYDASNNVATSSAVAVTVNNPISSASSIAVDSNATATVNAVLQYLTNLPTGTSNRMISGQYTDWRNGDTTDCNNGCDDLAAIKANTGKDVGILMNDWSFSDTRISNQQIIDYWNAGGLIMSRFAHQQPCDLFSL